VKEETTSNSCFVNTTCPSKFLLPEKGVTIEWTTKVRAKVQALVNGVTRNSNFAMFGVVPTSGNNSRRCEESSEIALSYSFKALGWGETQKSVVSMRRRVNENKTLLD
jgi:hypothetical protein